MAAAGYAVAPVRIALNSYGKKQLDTGGASWSAMSTTDVPTVASWFAGPYAGWSYVVDTEKSGIVVVDLDGAEGVENWRALDLPRSLMSVRTRSGGFHGYYAADPEVPVYNSSSGPADRVDIRGQGGVVFGPGSVVEGVADQHWQLAAGAPIPVAHLPRVPASAINQLTAYRGRGRSIHHKSLSIQREQAYSNLLAARQQVLDLPLGYGVNTAIWHLGAEAGQWAAAVDAPDEAALDYVLAAVRERFGEVDGDDQRAAERGVETGLERPWNFFRLEDFISQDFTSAGMPVPADLKSATFADALVDDYEDLLREPKPPALVHGLIDAGTYGLVFGPGGSGKSFVMLDIAASIATGRAWNGMATERGRVLYVAAEGTRGIAERLDAWRAAYRTKPPVTLFRRSLDVFGLLNPTDYGDLVAYLRAASENGRPFAAVAFDTLNRCAPGAEENSAKDVSLINEKLAALRAFGTAAIVLHHTPKDGSTPRGSTALLNATDWALRVSMSGAVITVDNDRQKDRASTGTWTFNLNTAGTSAYPVPVVMAPGSGEEDWLAGYRPHYDEILSRLMVARPNAAPLGNAEQIMVETRVVCKKAPRNGEPARALVRDIKRWESERSNPRTES